MTRFTVELDLPGALLLLRAVDRECRVLGHEAAARAGAAALVEALAALVVRLESAAEQPAAAAVLPAEPPERIARQYTQGHE